MKSPFLIILAVSLIVGVACVAGKTDASPKITATDKPGAFPEIPRITKEELRPMLGNPDIIILDCRPVEQWRETKQKLPGAAHVDPYDAESLAHKYSKDKTFILY